MSILPGMFPPGAGAGAGIPAARYVNGYTASPAGTTGAVVTVPAVDLAFGGPRQILAIVRTTTGISAITIDGVTPSRHNILGGGFQDFYSAPYNGAGPFNIALTYSGVTSEITRVDVYEVKNAAPLYQGNQNGIALAATSLDANVRLPFRGIIIGGAFSATDTTTFTWSGVTERNDLDAGSVRTSTADTLTGAAAAADQAVNVTASAATTNVAQAMVVVPDTRLLNVTLHRVSFSSLAGSATVTFTNQDYSGLGNFRLIVLIASESDQSITGVSFAGNALTAIGTVTNTGASPDLQLTAWYIDILAAGTTTGSLVVTFSGIAVGPTFSVARLLCYNVGSISAIQSTSGNATGAALNQDVAEGGCIVAQHIRAVDSTVVTWTGVVSAFDLDSGLHRHSVGLRPYAPAETGRSVQASGTSGQYATMTFALNP